MPTSSALKKIRNSYRYYLWADDGLWKIPSRLHRGLVQGKDVLLQYAGTKQKILEVHVRNSGNSRILNYRGTVYVFDGTGSLDMSDQAEAVVVGLGGSHARKIGEKVVDIASLLQTQRWRRERIWSPTPTMREQIKRDIDSASVGSRVRVLFAAKESRS